MNPEQFKTGMLCRTKGCYNFWCYNARPDDGCAEFPEHSVGWEYFKDTNWRIEVERPKGEIVILLRGFTALNERGSYGFIELLLSDGTRGRLYVDYGAIAQRVGDLLEPVDT